MITQGIKGQLYETKITKVAKFKAKWCGED